jgi:uncharacterized protein
MLRRLMKWKGAPHYNNSFGLWGLVLLLACFGASAATFDCNKAKTEVEKDICADPQLSKLDEDLGAAYRGAMERAKQTEKGKLRNEQLAWIKSRNACKDKLCIEVMYRTRVAMLTSARPRKAGSAGVPASQDGRFWLTYGHGVKVCEAYLERLNRSSYEHHPKCDRPEDASVPGFRPLNRIVLSPEDMQPFWASVESFIESGVPERWKAADASNRSLALPLQYGDRKNQLRRLRGEMLYRRGFRFEPPIDIDGDGGADRVVVWRLGECRPVGPRNQLRRWDSIPIVLNAAGDGPDVERTRKIFGHPAGGYPLSRSEMAKEFRPIGRQMGIFNFEGTYYMDTFLDAWGDFNGNLRDAPATGEPKPAKEPEITNSLAVFVRRDGETKQVCEYWFEDFPEPRSTQR